MDTEAEKFSKNCNSIERCHGRKKKLLYIKMLVFKKCNKKSHKFSAWKNLWLVLYSYLGGQ